MGVNRLCGKSAVRAGGRSLKLYDCYDSMSFVNIDLAPLLARAWRIQLQQWPCRAVPKRANSNPKN